MGGRTIQPSPTFKHERGDTRKPMEEHKTPHDRYNYEKTKYNSYDPNQSENQSQVSDKSGFSYLNSSNRGGDMGRGNGFYGKSN